MGSIPGQGTKIPQTTQRSQTIATTKKQNGRNPEYTLKPVTESTLQFAGGISVTLL